VGRDNKRPIRYELLLTLILALFYLVPISAQLCPTPAQPFFESNGQQIINSYTAVTDICGNTFEVASPNCFSAGMEVMIIQMQGATATYSEDTLSGTVTTSNYGSAGLYELNTIRSISGNTILFDRVVANEYEVSGKVQLVSVPNVGEQQVLTQAYTCLAWNGTTGGVLAFTGGRLSLGASIDVSGKGFRGGIARNFHRDCEEQMYNYPPPNLTTGEGTATGEKGEGIAATPFNSRHGAGKSSIGGGGGNLHNGGGGGGGNAGGGGIGGDYTDNQNSCYFPVLAIGGQVLIAGRSRLFMGGGGGAGHANNNDLKSGGNGGGIIYIRATSINSSPIRLLNASGKNGTPHYSSDHDGGGGGGGGGTIVLELMGNTNGVLINISGGNGSDVDYKHGGGGGGGGGWGFHNQPTLNAPIIYRGGKGGEESSGSTGGGDGKKGKVVRDYFSIAPTERYIPPTIISTETTPECDSTSTLVIDYEATNGELFINNQQVTGEVFTNLSTGTYRLKLTNGCDTTMEEVSVQNYPVLGSTLGLAAPFICERPGTIEVERTGGKPPYVFTLNDSLVQNNGIFPGLAAGEYRVNITDDLGCEASRTVNIPDSSYTLRPVLPNRVIEQRGETFVLPLEISTPYPPLRYEWSPTDIFLDSTASVPELLSPTQFNSAIQLRVTDAVGCTGEAGTEILITNPKFYVPTAFSPNGDDLNETLLLQANSTLKGRILEFQVFNRWGGSVYNWCNDNTGEERRCVTDLNNPLHGTVLWDGTALGKLAEVGVYPYHLAIELNPIIITLNYGIVTKANLLLIFLFVFLWLSSSSLVSQCETTCTAGALEVIDTKQGACYDCRRRILELTPLPNSCGSAVYLSDTGAFLGNLDLLNGFRLPLRLNFGSNDNGREGMTFVLATDRNNILAQGEGGYMGYENIDNSIGFVFDVHPNTEAPFFETMPEDNLRLMARGMLGDTLVGPVSIKAPVTMDYRDVEDSLDVSVLISYDPFLEIIEVYVNRYHRMTYKINLLEYFGQRFVFPGLVGCAGNEGPNFTLGISGTEVLFDETARDYDDCPEQNEFLDWVNLNPVDNGFWKLSGLTYEVTQLANYRPSMLATHYPLIDAEMSVDIEVLESFIDSSGLRENNDRDMFGVGFGFTAPFAQFNGTYRGILLDWMGDGDLSGQKPTGIFLSRLNGELEPEPWLVNNHPLATRSPSAAYQIVDRLDLPSWDKGKTYRFTTRYLSDSLEVTIRDITNPITQEEVYFYAGPHDGSPGRFLLYNFNQGGIKYKNYQDSLLHNFSINQDSICAGESITFKYDSLKTRQLTKILRNAFWDFGEYGQVQVLNNRRIDSVSQRFPEAGDWPVSLVLVDSSGCSHPVSRTVHVRPAPIIAFGGDTTLCDGDNLLLFSGDLDRPALWQDSVERISYLVDSSGVYSATNLDSNGCPSGDTITVAYRPPLVYDVEVSPDCPFGEEGSIRVINSGTDIPLMATLNGEEGLNYTGLVAGTYLLAVSDTFGCTAEAETIELPMGFSAMPIAEVTDASCIGRADGSITFGIYTPEYRLQFVGGAEDTIRLYQGLEAGSYSFVFTDTIGCQIMDTLEVDTPDTLRISGLQDTTLLIGQAIELMPQLSFGMPDSVVWSPPDRLTQTDGASATIRPEMTTTYRLRVVTTEGCRAEASVRITVDTEAQLYLPNAFSPNFDGFNDYYYPMAGRQAAAVRKITDFTVYGRNGGTVFQRNNFQPDDPAEGWDGTIDGKTALPQVFVYTIEWVRFDGVEVFETGNFVLFR